MEEKRNWNRTHGITIQQMASRILRREDNVYFKHDCILDILNMYFDECVKALNNGEKVNFSRLGTLTPTVHTPLSYNIKSLNDDENNPAKPFTGIKYTRNQTLKRCMNVTFNNNIKNGYAGLGDKCVCTPMQIGILKQHGLLENDYTLEGSEDNECTEE